MRKQKCLRETGDKLFLGSTSAIVFVDRTFAKILSESNHKWNNFTEGKMWYLKGFTVVRHGEPWMAIERWKRTVRLLKAWYQTSGFIELTFQYLLDLTLSMTDWQNSLDFFSSKCYPDLFQRLLDLTRCLWNSPQSSLRSRTDLHWI